MCFATAQALLLQLDHTDKMLRMADDLKSREAELVLTVQSAQPK